MTTATEWVPVSVAAARLRVHVRTIERRAAAGKLATQRGPDGTVAVELPCEASRPSGEAVADAMAVQADRQIRLAGAVVTVTERELADVREDLRITRSSARRAWQAVASLAAVSCVVVPAMVWWTVTTAERLRGDLRAAEGKAEAAEQLASERAMDADRLRADLDAARQLSLAVAVELKEARQPPDNRPVMMSWPFTLTPASTRQLSDAH